MHQPLLLLQRILVFICCFVFLLSRTWAQQSQPNIIYIMADDLGYGDLGSFGQTQIQTPRLDLMADEGMRFTDHYAGSTVCAPSRCVLMTGYHSGNSYIRGNATFPLRPEDVTVAELLKEAGYTTGLVGKWGLGEAGSDGVPNRQGFDYFYGYLNQIRAHNYYPDYLWENENQVSLENEIEIAQESYAKGVGSYATKKVDYSHDLMTAKAKDFITTHSSEPFFLYLAYTIPHANNESHLNDEHGMEVPDYGEYADKNWPEVEKGKAAMISRMDRDIGDLLDLLKEKGIAENTLVIFTSDNGPHAEGGSEPDFFDSNGPLTGIKRDLYEGGIRVPMIAWWPGRIESGTTSGHPSAFWDFLPTACAVAGVDAPSGIDGVSYLPTLLNEKQSAHEYLYWEFHERGKKQAIRKGDRKLVHLVEAGTYELFDLNQDPGEHHDLSASHPEEVAALTALMETARTPSDIFPWEVAGAQVTADKPVNGTRLLLVFAASIILLLVAIIVFKINPFLALLGTAIITGFLAGMPIEQISPTLTQGFGKTLGGIGIVIGLGIILGQLLAEANATQQISRSLLKAVGNKNAPLAVNITGYLASIPVFADAALVIFMPLVRQLSRVTKRPFILYAVSLGIGLMVTHSMVLPTPGPLAVADNMGLNIGVFLGYAVIVSIPASLAGGWLLGLGLGKYSNIKAEDEPFEAMEPVVEETHTNLPSGSLSMGLLLFPLLLILIGSILGLWIPPVTLGGKMIAFFGDKNVALLLGVVAASLTLKGYIKRSLSDVLLDAAAACGLILLITGAGGAFGSMITATGIGDYVKDTISAWDMSIIALGFILSMMMKTAQGSTTVALITASSIMGQIDGLGTSPVLVALAICAGGMVFTLPNDSGFWVFSRFARLSVPNTLRSWTVGSGVAGFTAFLMILLLSLFADILPGL